MPISARIPPYGHFYLAACWFFTAVSWACAEPASVASVPAEGVRASGGLSSFQLSLPDEAAWTARAVRAGGGVAVRGPRGGVAVGRRGAGAIARPGRQGAVAPGRRAVVVAPGGWRRPASYYWRPGGAIAAGAAIGFVGAAAALSYAGSPPAPGYCWYYTSPERYQGFWDVCPP